MFICRKRVCQHDPEFRSLTQHAAAGDRSAEEFCQTLTDIKAEAGTLSRALIIGFLLERHEHTALEFAADALPGIADYIGVFNIRICISRVHFETDGSACRREFDGIAEQVHQDAFHMLGIHQTIAALAAVDNVMESLSGFSCPLADDRVNIFKKSILLDCMAYRHDLSRIDTACLENFLYQAHQITARRLYFLQIITDRLRKRFILQAELCETEDGGHGRSHVVAHMREERFLFTAGTYCLAQCPCHLLDLLLVVNLFRGVDKRNDEAFYSHRCR